MQSYSSHISAWRLKMGFWVPAAAALACQDADTHPSHPPTPNADCRDLGAGVDTAAIARGAAQQPLCSAARPSSSPLCARATACARTRLLFPLARSARACQGSRRARACGSRGQASSRSYIYYVPHGVLARRRAGRGGGRRCSVLLTRSSGRRRGPPRGARSPIVRLESLPALHALRVGTEPE